MEQRRVLLIPSVWYLFSARDSLLNSSSRVTFAAYRDQIISNWRVSALGFLDRRDVSFVAD